MSDPPTTPSWLAPVVVTLLVMQLGLAWVQGSLLHRQHQDLLDLREDVQVLTDTLEEALWQEEDYEDSAAPAQHGRRHSLRRVRAMRAQDPPPAEEDPAQKELRESAESAQKAVKKARATQSQLSFEENARKAEEKAQVAEAERGWRTWLLVALVAGLLAWVVRAWLQRRG
jgi:ElaB/YqjD/DUF883 family membrane-anchored ribosome-binding protein